MERFKSLDAVFLAIERPVSPTNVGSVGVFEGPAPSISVGVWSYCGVLSFGVTADRESVGDLDALMHGILDAVARLVRSAQ